jgi:hypothetical protein
VPAHLACGLCCESLDESRGAVCVLHADRPEDSTVHVACLLLTYHSQARAPCPMCNQDTAVPETHAGMSDRVYGMAVVQKDGGAALDMTTTPATTVVCQEQSPTGQDDPLVLWSPKALEATWVQRLAHALLTWFGRSPDHQWWASVCPHGATVTVTGTCYLRITEYGLHHVSRGVSPTVFDLELLLDVQRALLMVLHKVHKRVAMETKLGKLLTACAFRELLVDRGQPHVSAATLSWALVCSRCQAPCESPPGLLYSSWMYPDWMATKFYVYWPDVGDGTRLRTEVIHHGVGLCPVTRTPEGMAFFSTWRVTGGPGAANLHQVCQVCWPLCSKELVACRRDLLVHDGRLGPRGPRGLLFLPGVCAVAGGCQ